MARNPSALSRGAAATEETAIRQHFDDLLAAWGRGDGQTYGALFSEDADHIDFDGSRT